MKISGKKSEIPLYIIVSVICILIFLFNSLKTTAPENAVAMSGEWKISTETREIEQQPPPVYFSGGENNFQDGIFSYEYSFDLDNEYLEDLKKPVIVFPAISGNGIRVTVNNEVVGLKGDLIYGNASVWNFSYAFYLPENLLKPGNNIKVELYSLYEVGLNKVPYLADAGKNAKFRVSSILRQEDLMLLLIGGMLLLSIVFIITGTASGFRDIQKIWLGFAFLFNSIYFLDSAFLNNTGMSYLIFKKAVISSHFTGLLFFVLYLSELAGLRKNRIRIIYPAFLAVLTVLTIVWPGNMVQFRQYYQIAYSSDFVLFVYLVYLFIRVRKHTVEMIAIFSGGIAATIFAIHDVICLFLPGGQTFFSQTGIAILFFSGAAVIIYQIINIYIESIHQSTRAEKFYAESMMDPLTGAYNRKIFPALETGISGSHAVILFDLDDFKKINDSHGHGAGDLALKAFIEQIKSHTRNNDFVIRIGGDEFIAVLPGCELKTAEDLGSKINEAVKDLELTYGGITFRISATLGTAYGSAGSRLSDTIAEADRQMYSRKNI